MICGTGDTLLDLVNCGFYYMFGGDSTLAAVAVLIILAVMCYYFRITAVIALTFGFALTYFFYMQWQSPILLAFLALLGIGLGIRIATGIWRIVREGT